MGSIAIGLLAIAACFVPAGTATASPSAGPALRALQTLENKQYHGLAAGQYHRIARSRGPASESFSQWRELGKTISARVISPTFTSRSPNQMTKTVTSRSEATGKRIAFRNGRSIGGRIESENINDPRVMLGIGACLGLCYLTFLAVWFWATRFRMRPPRSAPS